MKPLIRLRPHPADAQLVDVLAGPECAQLMGRYQPARYEPARRCYVVHAEDMDTFMVFARINGLHVINQPRPYQPPRVGGRCPCGEDDCTRARTITPQQAEINEWGAFKVRAAVKRHRGLPLTPQDEVALAELDAWVDLRPDPHRYGSDQ
jgi:hypothetical protein